MSLADEIAKLQELYRSGALSEAEFQAAKARLIASESPPPRSSAGTFAAFAGNANIDSQTRTWAMLIHLTQFAGHVAPLAGLVVPIVLWQIKKNELPGIDVHGRNVANWILSELIYAVVSVLLCFVVVGVPLLIALGILSIVFPIIGGVKAASGEAWRYPLSIRFFSDPEA
ncbi:MAG: hypothetical protein DCC68_24230 [Planctomycetota bacterium]|nr:MAG: hypothetical protein DCC68_24230 [Planctomycetota bacterium]